LNEESGYRATREGDNVVLRSSSGRRLGTFAGVMQVVGGKHVRLMGRAENGVRDGLYRDHLEIRTASGTGLNAINAIDLEDYLMGVVPSESPASWPAAALEAQAVAARSYALAANVNGKGFDQYADTRSQVYRGYLGETPATNSAVAATAREVVTYGGEIATTFFFSTSGGHTENNEFSSLGFGQPPIPYLRGVDDPYEAEVGSPYEHWKRKFSLGRMNSALSGLGLRGKLRNIVVTQRGASPRIVHAKLVGGGGSTAVTGPQLQTALGLPDTWAFFKKK
jgi:stage II sporulation protein D